MNFDLTAPYTPQGDQPKAIAALTEGLAAGEKHQVLLGVTGSGKTFTMANVIQNIRRPTLVMSHNKTLAAQLYSEFKQFFPHNAVEYFVSYFDYYQPEAYLPQTDTYIEKDSSINDEIERLRLSATASLLTRSDVIVVASVSCIYGLGSPDDFYDMLLSVELGKRVARDFVLGRLVDMQYQRNDIVLERGKFRVRGDIIEVCPASTEDAIRIEFFGDEIERIRLFDPLTGNVKEECSKLSILPAKQFVTPYSKVQKAIVTIREEMEERVQWFEQHNKLLEAQRIRQRTEYDLEMIQEVGYCSGIENYSRHLSGRPPGSRPYTLLDFFPKDFLLILDESHVTLPQIQGMFHGDRSRKTVLVEHGFRLPSALDNRPLNFDEFNGILHQALYVSATPGPYELGLTHGKFIEQIIRPTGILDPEIEIKPLEGQIDDTIEQVRERASLNERTLVTTLTKRTAEDLAEYLRKVGLRVRHLHSEIDAIERVEILRALRKGEFDVLVGINLLREGLDLPEVSLVCILDADKEGFLRSAAALIQTAGRAARHINGHVILYADTVTDSIRELLRVTAYRREAQARFNEENGIVPRSTTRQEQESLHTILRPSSSADPDNPADLAQLLAELEAEMKEASGKLEYERAALLRDQIFELRAQSPNDTGRGPSLGTSSVSYRRGKKSAKRKR
jgi:excinuclease ABC subunit B